MLCKLVLEAVDTLANRKTRPNFENVASFLSEEYGVAEVETQKEINFLLTEELIVEVCFKNVKSYRVASNWNRAHLGCQREEADRLKRLIRQAIVAVAKGKMIGKTVLNVSDVESSPESVCSRKSAGNGRRALGRGGGGDVNGRGANFDEIMGFVRLKEAAANVTAIKLKTVLDRELRLGKLKMLENGCFDLTKGFRASKRRQTPKPSMKRVSALRDSPPPLAESFLHAAPTESIPSEVDVSRPQVDDSHSPVDVGCPQVCVSHPKVDISRPKVDVCRSQVDVSHSYVDVSHSQVDVSRSQVDISHSQVDASHSQVDASHSQVDVSRSQVDVSYSQVDVSHSQVDVSRSHTDVSRSHIDVSCSHVDVSHSHVDVSRSHVDVSHSHVDVSHSHVGVSRSHVDASRFQVDDSRSQVNDSHSQVDNSYPQVDNSYPQDDDSYPQDDVSRPQVDRRSHIDVSRSQVDISRPQVDVSHSQVDASCLNPRTSSPRPKSILSATPSPALPSMRSSSSSSSSSSPSSSPPLPSNRVGSSDPTFASHFRHLDDVAGDGDEGALAAWKETERSVDDPCDAKTNVTMMETEAKEVFGGVGDWTVEQVSTYMLEKGLPSCASRFAGERIDGRALLLLTRNDVLSRLGLKVGVALKAFRHVHQLQRQSLGE